MGGQLNANGIQTNADVDPRDIPANLWLHFNVLCLKLCCEAPFAMTLWAMPIHVTELSRPFENSSFSSLFQWQMVEMHCPRFANHHITIVVFTAVPFVSYYFFDKCQIFRPSKNAATVENSSWTLSCFPDFELISNVHLIIRCNNIIVNWGCSAHSIWRLIWCVMLVSFQSNSEYRSQVLVVRHLNV